MATADHINAQRVVASVMERLRKETNIYEFRRLIEEERKRLSKLAQCYLDEAIIAAGIIVEVGPEMSEEERLQAHRVWETNNTHEQARSPRLYAAEPQVTMPSPEQVLLAQLMDIHPELGVWALERFQKGDDVITVRNRIGAIMNTVERD